LKTQGTSSAPGFPPATKVAAAIALVLVTTLTPASRPLWFAAEAALIAVAVLGARVPLRPLLRRLVVLSPFMAGAALAAALGSHGADWRVLAARSTVCLATVIVLSQTTSISELLGVLRAARVPNLLLTTLSLRHRYLFVLADESTRMGRARTARTFTRGRRFAWVSAASVVGQLFVRASERAERVYDAMCARGWKA